MKTSFLCNRKLAQPPPSCVTYTLLYNIIMYMCNVYSSRQEGVKRKGVLHILYTVVYKGSIKNGEEAETRRSRNEKKLK